jgi:hypothetical protein
MKQSIIYKIYCTLYSKIKIKCLALIISQKQIISYYTAVKIIILKYCSLIDQWLIYK